MSGEWILAARDVSYRYPGSDRNAVSGVSVEGSPGTMVAVLGPNGSGKTTLLRILAGGAEPSEGVVELGALGLPDWEGRALARHVAVVTQIEHVPFPVTVEALVGMGRYAHLGPWRAPRGEDRKAVEAAMDRCGVAAFRKREFQTLSGGERQRVRIARALAQEPRVLLLDEPTVALDMHYEMAIFRLLAELRSSEGVAIVVVTHNVNLAARFADHLVLMKDGKVAVEGPPADVVTPARMAEVFDWPVSVVTHSFREGPAPQLFPE